MTNEDDTPIEMTIQKLDSLTEPVVLHHPPQLPKIIIAVVACFGVVLLVLILGLAWAVTDNLNDVTDDQERQTARIDDIAVRADHTAKEVQKRSIINSCIIAAQTDIQFLTAAIASGARNREPPEIVQQRLDALATATDALPGKIEACQGVAGP